MTGFKSASSGFLALGLMAAAIGFVQAEEFNGICQVTAGSTSQSKYAVLKCAREASPRTFEIRKTIFERDDAEAYRNLARFAGRSFNCTLTRTGRSTRSDTVTTSYSLTDCR